MFNSSSISQLYANVLHEDIVHHGVKEHEIRKGIQTMAHVYRPEPTSLRSEKVDVANYNEIGLRCAYLHKFAAFHTALVLDAMNQILEKHEPLLKKVITTGQFKLCCIGGGPGTDAIGIFAALNFTFGIFQKDVVIIDVMENWKFTFDSLIQQIIYGDYAIKENFVRDCFQWNYIGINLLDSISSVANAAISNANFISMVKFVSAAACQDTESMVTKIFEAMKPGALVLFIDNAGGGFHQLVNGAANQVGLVTKFGPLRHHKYTNEELRITRFGYTSCCATTVTIHLLQKPHRNQQTRFHNSSPSQRQNSNGPTFIFNKPRPTRNDFSYSKLHSPQNSVSPGMDTNLNKLFYSTEINSAKHNGSPAKDQKLNNKLPKTPLNQDLTCSTRTNNQVSYSYIPSEPVFIPTRNDFSNSKLHSPQNSVSPGMNTNPNKLFYSTEINSAKHSGSPAEDQKLNNKLPKTPLNQDLTSRTPTNNQASYSCIPSVPVSPIYNESIYNRSNYNVSSRPSAQSEPDAFHESSNNADDGCCSCCVIS